MIFVHWNTSIRKVSGLCGHAGVSVSSIYSDAGGWLDKQLPDVPGP